MRRIILLGIVALSLLFVGCIGGADDDEDSDRLEQAQVTDDTGGIEGIVTDEAIEAIPAITVTIEETGETTESGIDGSFAFSELPPETYTLTFDGPGFLATEEEVEVRQAEVSFVDVVLTPEPERTPYMVQDAMKGFIECSAASPVVLVAVCSVPNAVTQFLGIEGNATNDRFLFEWYIEPDAWQFVAEMEWEDNQPLAEEFRMIVEPGISNEDQTRFVEETGPSPLHASIDRDRIVEVDQILDELCEGERDPEGALAPQDPETYCGYDIIEEGAMFHTRVFVDDSSEVTLAAAVQQEFTHYVTTFHHGPACEDFSIVGNNECPVVGEPLEDEYTPDPEE